MIASKKLSAIPENIRKDDIAVPVRPLPALQCTTVVLVSFWQRNWSIWLQTSKSITRDGEWWSSHE
jgi:hypothetical protein